MEIVTHNATSLAWIGDAVMSLSVREHLLKKGYRKPDVLQKMSARICSAKGQASILQQLEQKNWFDEQEKVILHRGRNATIHTKAKNASQQTYLQATSLEALLGYLYLYEHEERLQALLGEIKELGDLL